MGTIETKIDQSRDLTTVKATGKMVRDDFRKWRMGYYSGKTTLKMIWDVSDADLSEIESEDVLLHVRRINADAADVRKGGKTAVLVGGNTLALGLGRMREIYGEMENSPMAINIFTNADEAMEWLGIKDS